MDRDSRTTFLLGLACGLLFAVPLSVVGGFGVFAFLKKIESSLGAEADVGVEEYPERPSGVEAEPRPRDRRPLLARAAPEFSTPTLDGGVWRLADHRGKVVVLDFWASWCKPCIKAIPTLRDVYRRYRDNPDFVMMGISVDSERRDLVRSIERHGVEWPQLYEDGKGWENSVARLYQVRSIPHVLVIDRQGVVRAYPSGEQLGAQIERLVDSASVPQPQRRDHVTQGYTLKGVMLYRGAPLSKWTDQEPRFTIREDHKKGDWSGATLSYSRETGRFEIQNAPRGGTVEFTVAAMNGKRIYPGAFRAKDSYDLRRSQEIESVFERILHLHEPWDNTEDSGHGSLKYESPLRFEWEGMEGATRYRVQVLRSRDAGHSEGYGYIETAIDERVEGTSRTIDLVPSQPLEHYEFMMYAYDGTENQIAYYMSTQGGRIHNHTHLFKIAPRLD